ncbi:uncharacterized protein LOC114261675 isoform X2 [Camellia sinensis]|uniref:uncharacterized protein LOC114261675 isoform X2 n=1 Tax=Camellia sinensis TaxID=4442 RepID=UPI001035AC40|nr:uncharacterized protein LOC114261675 isoform X2 [Camellia sinensis]
MSFFLTCYIVVTTEGIPIRADGGVDFYLLPHLEEELVVEEVLAAEEEQIQEDPLNYKATISEIMSPKNFLVILADRKCQKEGGSVSTTLAASKQSPIIVVEDSPLAPFLAVTSPDLPPPDLSFGKCLVEQSTEERVKRRVDPSLTLVVISSQEVAFASSPLILMPALKDRPLSALILRLAMSKWLLPWSAISFSQQTMVDCAISLMWPYSPKPCTFLWCVFIFLMRPCIIMIDSSKLLTSSSPLKKGWMKG